MSAILVDVKSKGLLVFTQLRIIVTSVGLRFIFAPSQLDDVLAAARPDQIAQEAQILDNGGSFPRRPVVRNLACLDDHGFATPDFGFALVDRGCFCFSARCLASRIRCGGTEKHAPNRAEARQCGDREIEFPACVWATQRHIANYQQCARP